jgi:hypothetical protein
MSKCGYPESRAGTDLHNALLVDAIAAKVTEGEVSIEMYQGGLGDGLGSSNQPPLTTYYPFLRLFAWSIGSEVNG